MDNFTFIPIQVNKGRKFRGNAYSIGAEPRIGSSGWAFTSWNLKLWDPTARIFVYANPEFIESREASAETIETDRKAYIDSIINGTYEWCRSKSSNDEEARKFARNCLVKRYPELIEYIDAALPDERDVAAAVEQALHWAVNLRTRPCVIYGRTCKGGKPYGKTETVRKAWRSLDKKGYTKRNGFVEIWKLMTAIMDLPGDSVLRQMNAESGEKS